MNNSVLAGSLVWFWNTYILPAIKGIRNDTVIFEDELLGQLNFTFDGQDLVVDGQNLMFGELYYVENIGSFFANSVNTLKVPYHLIENGFTAGSSNIFHKKIRVTRNSIFLY